jgi:NAD-dependent protein deacetylase/lipoamidase
VATIDDRTRGTLKALGDRIRAARRVTILTGAGVSAASGVPTFRGAGGLWRSFRAEDLATPEAFHRDPALVWEWYDWRRSRLAACRPNPAHDVLARWSARDGVTLITQNVDGLHELAGADAVVRFHGSIWRLRCVRPCGGAPDTWEDRSVPLPVRPPRCPACGGYARPAVVWFGESIDSAVLSRCIDATACDVYLSIGTSSLVQPAAGLVSQARSRGAYTVEINPEPTASAPYVDLALAMPAEIALPAIDE